MRNTYFSGRPISSSLDPSISQSLKNGKYSNLTYFCFRFDALSVDQRVNALTTTAPYLAEIIRNMAESENRYDCILEFEQNS